MTFTTLEASVITPILQGRLLRLREAESHAQDPITRNSRSRDEKQSCGLWRATPLTEPSLASSVHRCLLNMLAPLGFAQGSTQRRKALLERVEGVHPPTGHLAVLCRGGAGAGAAGMTSGAGALRRVGGWGGLRMADKATGRDQGPGGPRARGERGSEGHGRLSPKAFLHPSCIPRAPEVWKALGVGGFSHSLLLNGVEGEGAYTSGPPQGLSTL